MTLERPSADGGIHVQTSADLVDQICDDFEDQWRKGPPPAVEEFLHRCSSSDRGELFTELLLVDLEQRKARNAPFSFDEYLGRFPDYSVELESVWLRLGIQETVVLASTDTPADRYRRGARIAQFELQEKLGSGGSGEVWKALDTRLQRTVAIKVPRHRQLSEEDLQRFLREGQAAAQLRHSHLVSVHEVGHDGQTAFIVSEFIDGADLRAWLRRRRRPTPRESAQLMADIAEALHHAHEHGVVHRDLKPANVLMDRDDQAHVTDFGLAKWTEDARDMTVDGQILGTPAYMSPEQARGEAHRVDRRTDVYALGTLLYELLTGRRPFEGDQATVMHHIVSTEPTRPRTIDKNVPRDLETVCLKSLEKDPARRYPSAQEMAVDLRRYLRSEPILARSAGRLERGVRWIRRRPAVATSILLALVAIGSLGIARMFAEENRQLLGLRLVTLTTEPVGARVTFVPLNDVTDAPMPDKLIHARTPSPVVEELRPGDYLVVAVLGDGRFHEVFRHVPEKEENLPGAYAHLRWKREGDALALPKINVPPQSVTENMAFVPGTDRPAHDGTGSSADTEGGSPVASFYVDFGEATVADYQRAFGQLPIDKGWSNAPGSHAVNLRYDQAIAMAERLGKRLPSLQEHEFIATSRGKCAWPWGDTQPPEDQVTEFGPVGTPAFDRWTGDVRVAGLCSNVAEWTSTSAAQFFVGKLPGGQRTTQVRGPQNAPILVIANKFQAERYVGGGDLAVVDGNASVSVEHRSPAARVVVPQGAARPGLGFRAYRSAKPRETPEAF